MSHILVNTGQHLFSFRSTDVGTVFYIVADPVDPNTIVADATALIATVKEKLQFVDLHAGAAFVLSWDDYQKLALSQFEEINSLGLIVPVPDEGQTTKEHLESFTAWMESHLR